MILLMDNNSSSTYSHYFTARFFCILYETLIGFHPSILEVVNDNIPNLYAKLDDALMVPLTNSIGKRPMEFHWVKNDG
jgi:hypothetical protein